MELTVTPATPTGLSLIGKQNRTFTEDELLGIIRQNQLAAEESLQRVHTEIKDQKEKLYRQIEGLQYQLLVLKTQEDDIVNVVKRYSTAFSPHNKLPPEMLRHIFKCCVHENEVKEISTTYKGGAYTISRICSTWRRIALDTPELWSGISLQLTKENEKQIRFARQWLSRARTLPRSISIKRDSSGCDVWGNNVILNLVVHYPLRSLELTLPHEQLKQLKGLLDKSLSTLEALRLKCSSGGTGVLPFGSTDTLPKMNVLVLEGRWDLQDLMAVGLAWSRIVHLKIDSEISLLLCVTVLQQCSQIEFCSLHVERTNNETTVPDIVLPQIHTLYINTEGMTIKLLVGAVTAPKLKDLAFLSDDIHLRDVDTTAFCQMIERCQGLEHLTTFRVGPTSESLNPLILLEKLPHLETMEIWNGLFDEDAINSISLGKVGPKLRKLIVTSRSLRHDANRILQMVEARQQNASMNSNWPLAQITPFTEITFNCASVSSYLKEDLIHRKHALEKSVGNININLTFD